MKRGSPCRRRFGSIDLDDPLAGLDLNHVRRPRTRLDRLGSLRDQRQRQLQLALLRLLLPPTALRLLVLRNPTAALLLLPGTGASGASGASGAGNILTYFFVRHSALSCAKWPNPPAAEGYRSSQSDTKSSRAPPNATQHRRAPRSASDWPEAL